MAQGATLAIPCDFRDGAGWVLCLASLTVQGGTKLCCALGQFPVSSPCAMERHGIQIFLGVFCKPQHLAEALRCCLFQLLPAEGMHRNVPILFSPVKRPLLSWEQQPHGALGVSLVLGRAILCSLCAWRGCFAQYFQSVPCSQPALVTGRSLSPFPNLSLEGDRSDNVL